MSIFFLLTSLNSNLNVLSDQGYSQECRINTEYLQVGTVGFILRLYLLDQAERPRINNANPVPIYLQMHCNIGSRVLARCLALHVDQ